MTGINYIPERHQVYGQQRIVDTLGVFPIIDMGLGKTVMSLTAAIELKAMNLVKRILVVAPKKVAESTWPDEIEKWNHTRHLVYSKVLGSESHRKKALMQKADIYLINRENVAWLVAYYGSNWPFDMMIIDESSSFKNPQSIRFKQLRLVRRYCNRVVCLSGTPVPNGLLDIWTQVYLLDQGVRLGESYAKYRETYFDAGRRDGHVVYNYNIKEGDDILGKEFYQYEIYDRIKDVCFSMKTEDYKYLPEKRDNNLYITLSPAMQKKYNDFERDLVMQLADSTEEITAINAASLFGKLLQFASGAVYDKDKNWHLVHDEKIERLKEVVEDLKGKPLLIFYNFVSEKERILKVFKNARELKTPKDIKDWNEGKIEILLAHPKSAGHGLNLQFGGNSMFWFSCPTSLEEYLQGCKRVHRQGVVGEFVNNMRCIVRNTEDERVVKMVEGKDNVQNGMLAAVKAMIKKHVKQAA